MALHRMVSMQYLSRSTYKDTYPIKDKGPKACPRHGCALTCVLAKSGFPKSVWSM